MNVYGMVLAGGTGSRCGKEIPKQYAEVDGKPIFIYTLEEMQHYTDLKGVCVVCAEEWSDYVKKQCEKYNIELLCVSIGGKTGLNSIWNGLHTLESYDLEDDDIIVIQDANRPLLDWRDIAAGVKTCLLDGCSIAATEQVCDMVEAVSEIGKKRLVRRDGLMEVIRPEFHTVANLRHCRELWYSKKVHSQNPACMLLENQENIEIFDCKSVPIKITFARDLEMFKAILHWRNWMEKGKNE